MKTKDHFEQVKFWTVAAMNESAAQYCWMHPMNVSMNEMKWDGDNFRMHNEGIGKIDNDKLFSFTYYQWCAFFFLMQVRTST